MFPLPCGLGPPPDCLSRVSGANRPSEGTEGRTKRFPRPSPLLFVHYTNSRGRLDSIRHLFYFFLFLFFNLVAGERSGLVIDVAVSEPQTGNHSRCRGSLKPFPQSQQ